MPCLPSHNLTELGVYLLNQLSSLHDLASAVHLANVNSHGSLTESDEAQVEAIAIPKNIKVFFDSPNAPVRKWARYPRFSSYSSFS